MKSQPAEVEKADANESHESSLTGAASVVYAISQLTGIKSADIPADESVGWFNRLQTWLGERGYDLNREDAKLSIRDRHVGIFTVNGYLSAAVFEGDKVTNNPTSANVTANRLTQRLRVTKITPQEPAEDAEASGE